MPEELRDVFQEDFFCQCDCDRVGLEAADALANSIAIEALCLYLSGDLKRLEEEGIG